MMGVATWDASVFDQAKENMVSSGIEKTPMKRSLWLSREVGAEVYLKFENLHEGGSFKVRGGHNYLMQYKREYGKFPSKVIAASGGNHAIAVAVACHKCCVPCAIFIPKNSITDAKRYLLSQYNAEVRVEGEYYQQAHERALALVKTLKTNGEDPCYIHAYLDPWIIQGASTMMSEIIESSSTLPDVVVASLGGGGMLAGCISYLISSGLSTQVGSVETEGADYFYKSKQQGKLITLDGITSIAKTLGASTGSEETFKLFSEHIDFPMRVSDKEAVAALWDILEHEKVLVEPSCSASIAGLLKYKENFKGKRVCVIVCGGNVTLKECEQWKKDFLTEKTE